MDKYLLIRLRPDKRVGGFLFDFTEGKDEFSKKELIEKYKSEVVNGRGKGLMIFKSIDIKELQ